MIQNGELIYSAEQIQVPPELPDILKNYTKYILKTQPKDILGASAEYFAGLSKNKSFSEPRKAVSDSQLEALYLQLASKNEAFVPKDQVVEVCAKLGISEQLAKDSITLGGWNEAVPYLQFWSLIIASTTTSLGATILAGAKVISAGRSTVAVQTVSDIFEFLAARDSNLDKAKVDAVRTAFVAVEGSDISIDNLHAILSKNVK